MRRLRINKVVIIFLSLLSISVTLVVIWKATASYNSGCPKDFYSSIDFEIVECRNSIVVERNFGQIYKYSIYDYTHKYEIGAANKYKLVDERVFFFDPSQTGGIFGEGTSRVTRYMRTYFVGDKINDYWFDGIEDLPRYVLVNTKSGEVTFYVKLDEMPEAERKIFEGLR